MKKTTWLSALSLLALVSGACGNNVDDPSEEAELCEHMTEGPQTAVTATADGTGAAVNTDHHRYDVTLTSGARSVSFAASEAEDFRFALNKNLPLTLTDSNGVAIGVEETKTSGISCDAVKVIYTAALPVGTSTLTLGGTDTSVSVVVEQAAHSHDHE
jgi:hypothetical protein